MSWNSLLAESNPVTVDHFAYLFNYRRVGVIYDGPDLTKTE